MVVCFFHIAWYRPPRSKSSWWLPTSTILPLWRTTIWSDVVMVERRWLHEISRVFTCNEKVLVLTYAIVIVVRPAVTRSRASWISLSVWVSRDAVASSRSRIRASFKIARAIAICSKARVNSHGS